MTHSTAILSFRAKRGISLTFLLVLPFFAALPASAQVATGTPPFGSFAGSPDVINLGNNNAHLCTPVVHKSGRGTNFTYDLCYDSSIWTPVGGYWVPNSNFGWSASSAISNNNTGYITYYSSQSYCYSPPYGQITGSDVYQGDMVYYDPWGVPHGFPGYVHVQGGTCGSINQNTFNFPETAPDGSGLVANGLSGPIIRPDGTTISPPVNPTGGTYSTTFTDRNGNQINSNSSGQFFDTLGSTALTVSGSGTSTSPMVFTYTPPNTSSSRCNATNTSGVACYAMSSVKYTVATNFAVSGINEKGAIAANLVDKITLPDGSFYQFTYEPTPSTPSNHACTPLSGTYQTNCVTARVTKITLPMGGFIAYAYSGGAGTNSSGIFADGSAATMLRTLNDGTNSNSWTYARSQISGAHWQTLVTDPANNQTSIDFQKDSGTNNFYEVQRKSYQGLTSGTLLRQWTTCYNGNTSNCATTAVSSPITQRNVNDQYGSSGLQCQHNFYYNSGGGLKEQDDYDYGSGAPGALLRKTLVTYASLPPNITAFQQAVTICNGTGSSSSCAGPSGGNTGTVVAQTNYNYDETTPTATSGIAQHTSVSGSRGNLTSVNYPVSGLTSHFTYYDTGSSNTSQDVNGATTTYNYSNNTADCQMAFPTSVSEPFGWSRSMAWNCTGAVSTSATDENSQVTSFVWSDPYFWRPAEEDFPDGGKTKWTYSQTSLQTQVLMNSTPTYITGTTLLDGLGRTKETQLNSDPEGADYTDTTYDSLGRVASVTNPYRTTSDYTYGMTSYAYDALGRPTQVTLQDGSVASISYTNNTVSATDPASKVRQSTLDSLGRLTQVIEDPGSSPHLNYVTSYGYDALGDLLSVTQNGSHPRTYNYDAMSRLTSESNPETGTITYKYDSDSNCASPNSSSGDLISRTDARSIRTCYQYDTLHRLTQKNYSDGTPTAFYSWDGSGRWGVTQTNTIGRLGEEWTGTSCCATGGAEIFGYDSMGRITMNEQYTPTMGYVPVNYTYDLGGDTLSATNIGGYQISYQYDAAARPINVTSNLIDSQHPATLATIDPSVGYYPFGAVQKMTFGNGLYEEVEIERRLQPCQINFNSSGSPLTGCGAIPSGNVQNYNNSFGTWGSTNSGEVTNIAASGAQNFNRAFTYDSLNRLATLNQSSGTATGCSSTFNLSWTYDAWGNRTDQTVNSGTCNPFHASVNSNNRLSGLPYQYDAAGNMTNDGNHTYFYDAENRLIQVDGTLGTCSTATACYLYDALGHRTESARPGSSEDFLHNLSGQVVGDWGTRTGYTGWDTGYVYLNGGLLAQYQGSTTHFAHLDHLGSTRLLTGLNQAVVQNLDYLPFGELNSSDSGINSHKFTGDERDSETDLDHTQFRQYSSQLGRWMHTDPAGLAAADPTNPQSWNRYSYVVNNAVSLIDPLGMDYCDGNSPYTSGGGGTTNLPPPCQIAPGVWDASYNGPTPDAQYLQNQTWQSVDTWFNNQGITEYAPLPTGVLNYNANQGDLGMLGSQEMAIGFKQIVAKIKDDWTKYGLDQNIAWFVLFYSLHDPTDYFAALSAINVDLNVLNNLDGWKSVSVPGLPPAPCAMNAGLAMGVWKGQLLAWLKSHPGQAPPPEIATPPSLSGVCG